MITIHRLKVEKFGPLDHVELNLSDMVFLLGEQASGKSTVAKLLYFFRTFRDEFIRLAFSNQADEWKSFRKSYISSLKREFTGVFGATRDLGRFSVTYTFVDGRWVNITPSEDSKYLSIQFSHELNARLTTIWDNAREVLFTSHDNTFSAFMNIVDENQARLDIVKNVKDTFDDDAHIVYVPAGRALLSHPYLLQLIQAEGIKRVTDDRTAAPFNIIDGPTRSYISEVNRVRQLYLNSQAFEVEEASKLTASTLSYMEELHKRILKGSYDPDKLTDYIQIQDNRRIPVTHASSGQQEVVWILNLLSLYAAEMRKCVLLIEEPETHLYPEAQYLLAKSVAAFCNLTKSQTVITTHSPYILSSFNNLIFAGKNGERLEIRDKIGKIINPKSWVSEHDFESFMLKDGTNVDIKDSDLAMIAIEELDEVASLQDREYEEMLAVSSVRYGH